MHEDAAMTGDAAQKTDVAIRSVINGHTER